MEAVSKHNRSNAILTPELMNEMLAKDMIARKLRRWKVAKYIPAKPMGYRDNFPYAISLLRTTGIFGAPNITVATEYLLESYPLLKEILSDRIIAAGGAVAKALWLSNVDYDIEPTLSCDVDLFFIAGDYNPIEYLREVILKMDAAWLTNPSRKSKIIRGKNAVTYIAEDDESYDLIEYQFVLRLYPSIGHILGGFDIPAAAIAFDGNNFLTVEFSQFCHQNHIVIADTTRRSTSYEWRLRKYSYYTHLIFPGINIGAIVEKRATAEAAFDDEVSKYLKPMFLMYRNGSVRSDMEAIQDLLTTTAASVGCQVNITLHNLISKIQQEAQKVVSEISKKYPGRNPYNFRIKCNKFNLKYTSRCMSEFTPLGYAYSDYAADDSDNIHSLFTGYGNISIFGGVEVLEAPNTDNIITRRMIKEHIESILRFSTWGTIACARRIGITLTINDFRLEDGSIPDPEYAIAPRLRTKKNLHQPTKMITDISDRVELLSKYLIERARAVIRDLPGLTFITENPGRQWTSSFNPIMADPRDWYGPEYSPYWIGDPSIERELWRARVVPPFNKLPHDIFRKIMLQVLFDYHY